MTKPGRLDLMGFPLDPVDLNGAADVLSAWMLDAPREPHTVVTLNPEFIVQARTDEPFARALRAADLVTADGVGIVWATKEVLGVSLPGRAPGYDLAVELMRRHGERLSVFFLGARPGIAELAAAKARESYGVKVAGVHHGYFDLADDQRVAEMVRDSGAHLLLAALGAPRQETFLQYWRQVMNVPVMMGVGGTLDVLAGNVKLSPSWTRRAGLEWVWRIASDRKRWNRAPRLARFVSMVRAAKRGAKR